MEKETTGEARARKGRGRGPEGEGDVAATRREAHFDLLEKPWIPAIGADARGVRVSVRGALAQAHELRGIEHTSPLATLSLVRMLLAVLERALGPATAAGLRTLEAEGRIRTGPGSPVGDYLGRTTALWDLFGDRPWMQSPDIPIRAVVTTAKFQPNDASGNNGTLQSHEVDRRPRALAAWEAACLLLAQHGWGFCGMIGSPYGLQSASAGPLNGLVLVWPTGESLFETLLRCRATAPPGMPWSGREDLPGWERPPLEGAATPERAHTGLADVYAFRSRQILLLPDAAPGPDGEPTVSGVLLAEGERQLRGIQRAGWEPMALMGGPGAKRPKATLKPKPKTKAGAEAAGKGAGEGEGAGDAPAPGLRAAEPAPWSVAWPAAAALCLGADIPGHARAHVLGFLGTWHRAHGDLVALTMTEMQSSNQLLHCWRERRGTLPGAALGDERVAARLGTALLAAKAGEDALITGSVVLQGQIRPGAQKDKIKPNPATLGRYWGSLEDAWAALAAAVAAGAGTGADDAWRERCARMSLAAMEREAGRWIRGRDMRGRAEGQGAHRRVLAARYRDLGLDLYRALSGKAGREGEGEDGQGKEEVA